MEGIEEARSAMTECIVPATDDFISLVDLTALSVCVVGLSVRPPCHSHRLSMGNSSSGVAWKADMSERGEDGTWRSSLRSVRPLGQLLARRWTWPRPCKHAMETSLRLEALDDVKEGVDDVAAW